MKGIALKDTTISQRKGETIPEEIEKVKISQNDCCSNECILYVEHILMEATTKTDGNLNEISRLKKG